MQEFHRRPQHYPEIRDPGERITDYDEIANEFQTEAAQAQSERCLQCGVPFCQIHCPLHNNIPDWLRYTAEGRLRDAYDMAASTNTFPEICGRICPQDRLCEGNCVVQSGFGAITIGAVEKYITETAWEQGWITPFTPAQELPFSVGIIGSGPAGMAAAEQLRKAGCQVHVYDRHDRTGGLMIYGIPNFKLDKHIVTRRTEQYTESGVVFHQGVDIGQDVTMAELQQTHDAVLIATGVYKPRELSLPHNHYPNVHKALDFLIHSNRRGMGDVVPEDEHNASSKDVVVIGGGDTAMDCVRTAVRQGATSVTCLYRRDRENMPGSKKEVRNAEEEGVVFKWLSAPATFYGESQVEAIDVQAMRLGAADASGRRAPVPVPGQIEQLPATMVIKALGFEAEDLPTLFHAPELRLSRHGTVGVDQQMMTSMEGVFAAGDIVRGASLVVWAIADGRDAAAHMLRYLRSKQHRSAVQSTASKAAV